MFIIYIIDKRYLECCQIRITGIIKFNVMSKNYFKHKNVFIKWIIIVITFDIFTILLNLDQTKMKPLQNIYIYRLQDILREQ